MKTKFIFFILIYCLPVFLLAQNQVDSLKNELIKAKHDSTRLNIYNKLFRKMLFTEPKLGLQYAKKFDSIANILQNKSEMARGRNFIGMANYAMGNYDESIKYYLEALKRYEILKDSLFIGIELNNIAASYQGREIPKQTIEYFKKALAIFDSIKNKKWQANVSKNLADEYVKAKDYTTAKKYAQLALNNFIDLKDDYSIGLAYVVLGNIELETEHYQQAISSYEKAKKLAVAEDDPVSLGIIYENIGNAHSHLENYDEAEKYLNQAVDIFRKHDAKQSLKVTLEILYEVYAKKGNFKKAFDTHLEFMTIKDSLFNEQKDKAMLDVLNKYESEKKEQQNKVLGLELKEQKNQTLIGILVAFGLLLVSGIVLYAWWRNRKKNQLLTSQNTLIQKQNNRLSELNEDKNALISIVSHDLSSPFSNIKLWSSVLNKSIDKPNEGITEAVGMINQSADYGMKMIQNVLTIEKAETNRHQLKLESFDLRAFTEEVIKDFEPASNSKKIKIHIDSMEDKITVLSDKQLMHRIFENLISNALKFSPPDKNVWIKLATSNDKFVIEIKDEGVGIATEELPHLFKKYASISSKTTQGENSTGLGLSIVKRLVDELGGTITCQSEIGNGTKFSLEFPN